MFRLVQEVSFKEEAMTKSANSHLTAALPMTDPLAKFLSNTLESTPFII
jgi:hypothetical protein